MSAPESDIHEGEVAIVLDFLAHGPSDESRPRYDQSAVGYALGMVSFRLYELDISSDGHVSIGDEVDLQSIDGDSAIQAVHPIRFEDLSSGARSELEYVVEDVVEGDETRFVDFFNDAQPVTLRLHQLNLLPGIGDKLRDGILEERKREPFGSFEDLEERVSGLHNPKDVIVRRILEEIKDDDVKYKTFIGKPRYDRG